MDLEQIVAVKMEGKGDVERGLGPTPHAACEPGADSRCAETLTPKSATCGRASTRSLAAPADSLPGTCDSHLW